MSGSGSEDVDDDEKKITEVFTACYIHLKLTKMSPCSHNLRRGGQIERNKVQRYSPQGDEGWKRNESASPATNEHGEMRLKLRLLFLAHGYMGVWGA